MKVLITYYPLGEAPKVADKLAQKFYEKKISVFKYPIELKKEFSIKEQFKKEKKLVLKEFPGKEKYDVIIIGTPIVSFTAVPAVNSFIRAIPKNEKTKVILFATGIGLPGRAIQKMKSLLSMKNMNVTDAQIFSSIFEFDQKKLAEVEKFFDNFYEKL